MNFYGFSFAYSVWKFKWIWFKGNDYYNFFLKTYMTWHEIEKFVMSVKCQNNKSTGEIFLAKVMLKGKSGEAESIKCVLYLPLCKVKIFPGSIKSVYLICWSLSTKTNSGKILLETVLIKIVLTNFKMQTGAELINSSWCL